MNGTIPTLTREQFARHLTKAQVEGVRVIKLSTVREDLGRVQSGKRQYEASLQGCTCAAGKAGTFCKHRALVLEMTGYADEVAPGWYDPQPGEGEDTPPTCDLCGKPEVEPIPLNRIDGKAVCQRCFHNGNRVTFSYDPDRPFEIQAHLTAPEEGPACPDGCGNPYPHTCDRCHDSGVIEVPGMAGETEVYVCNCATGDAIPEWERQAIYENTRSSILRSIR